VAARLSGEWSPRPAWIRDIPKGDRHDRAPLGPPQRPPFGHPVIMNGLVFVSDGSTLLAFNLLTGRESMSLVLGEPETIRNGENVPSDVCPTLSAAGDRLYVRVGPGTIKPADAMKADGTAIACIQVIP